MNPGAFPPGTTPADFRHRPHSVLVNEVIANALFKGGKTEGWGRGILDILNPGLQRKRIAELVGKSIPTIDRHLAILIKEDLIEHRDSDRNGGYYTKRRLLYKIN